MIDYKFISADTHFVISAEGLAPLQKIYGDRAPRIIAKEDADYLFLDGLPLQNLTAEGPRLAQRLNNEPSKTYTRLEDSHEGTLTPEGRIAVQDQDNIAADVLYAGTFGTVTYQLADEAYRISCVKAYNDWVAEFCAYCPERFVSQALLPLGKSIASSIKEAERAANMGFHAVLLPESEEHRSYNADRNYWEPLFEAISELGLVIGIHVGTITKSDMNFHERWKKFGLFYCMAVHHGFIKTVADILYSGVLSKYPKLQFVLAEGGIGWVADSIGFLDTIFLEYPGEDRGAIPDGEKPSDVFFRHFYATFQNDPVGLVTKNFLNLDRVLWGNDYPHMEGTYPHSRSMVEESFSKYLSAEEIRSVTRTNAEQLYGLSI